jgi:hypothetical protein
MNSNYNQGKKFKIVEKSYRRKADEKRFETKNFFTISKNMACCVTSTLHLLLREKPSYSSARCFFRILTVLIVLSEYNKR